MIIELHMLQNFAPSCLNRDDTNSPKECEFGGYRRARISSQCIKRAIRDSFKSKLLIDDKLIDPNTLAVRTKRLAGELTGLIVESGKKNKEDAQCIVTKALEGIKLALKEEKTEYLLFLGKKEIEELARMILEHWDILAKLPEKTTKKEETQKQDKKDEFPSEMKNALLKIMDGGRAADLALFGRMLANLPEKNIDAACQVAHAISTHKVGVEFDFYTALDDLPSKEETGAAMMGTIEFNSACYYRYANIDLRQLKDNLLGKPRDKASADELKEAEELARKTVEAFLRASVSAIPTGKQNSMAAQNPPSFIFAVVRDSGTWSLANAFARPVWTGNNGNLVQLSIEALTTYWNKLVKAYGDKGIKVKTAVMLDDMELDGITREDNFECFVKKVNEAIISNQQKGG